MNFKMINSLAIAAVLLLSGGFSAHAQTTADVIVYGSTPGGYCPAIAAARECTSATQVRIPSLRFTKSAIKKQNLHVTLGGIPVL